jgi:hypothetical protein
MSIETRIAEAIEDISIQLDNPSKISIDMDEDNNFYWVLKGIELNLERLADVLERQEAAKVLAD